jgi:DNA polymerase/3'-5' exonuclease PolX
MRLDEADMLAAHALRVLQAALPEATVTVAGELRRGLETVGGLDLIVTGAAPAALTRTVTSLLAGLDEATSSGTLAGYPVKITAVGEDGYGAALAVATGGDFAKPAAQSRRVRIREAPQS